jgi:hypothetical protein
VITKQSRNKYHTFLPYLLVYILNVYHSDIERIGRDQPSPQPDLDPIRPALQDLIRFINDLRAIPDCQSTAYQNIIIRTKDHLVAFFTSLLEQDLQSPSPTQQGVF